MGKLLNHASVAEKASPESNHRFVGFATNGKIYYTTFTTLQTLLTTVDAAALSTGVLADARVQESNVTQHEAALSITESQISDLGTYQPTSAKGQSNGYASLDAGAKVPAAQLPDSIVGQVEYQGTWAGDTNTPTIPAADTSNKGHYYVASSAVASGHGYSNVPNVDFAVGDWIISNGTGWEKVDNTDAVTTVFGRLGAIVAVATDYNAYYLRHDTAAQGLDGTAKGNALTNLGVTAFAQTILDDADAATVRATLGVVIGTNVQAYHANLAAVAGLTGAADKVPYFTGAGAMALATVTSFARTILDDADAAAVKATLGIGDAVSASSTFGTNLKLIVADGTAKGVKASAGLLNTFSGYGIGTSDSNTIAFGLGSSNGIFTTNQWTISAADEVAIQSTNEDITLTPNSSKHVNISAGGLKVGGTEVISSGRVGSFEALKASLSAVLSKAASDVSGSASTTHTVTITTSGVSWRPLVIEIKAAGVDANSAGAVGAWWIYQAKSFSGSGIGAGATLVDSGGDTGSFSTPSISYVSGTTSMVIDIVTTVTGKDYLITEVKVINHLGVVGIA